MIVRSCREKFRECHFVVEHAAESVSRREAAGPAIGGAGSVRELDSCAEATAVARADER